MKHSAFSEFLIHRHLPVCKLSRCVYAVFCRHCFIHGPISSLFRYSLWRDSFDCEFSLLRDTNLQDNFLGSRSLPVHVLLGMGGRGHGQTIYGEHQIVLLPSDFLSAGASSLLDFGASQPMGGGSSEGPVCVQARLFIFFCLFCLFFFFLLFVKTSIATVRRTCLTAAWTCIHCIDSI